MGKFIIALAFIIIAGFMTGKYLVGGTGDTVKSESTRIGDSSITEMKKIEIN
ncbi:hypothetical protein ACFQ88_38980 [Paenibacillus sp. NPDC056579]|uniref:hypothetical protein n=1 Tax=Paenibacillus sp. NPDC056579 TaxID=3345871 RepID=UPI003677939A